MIPGAIVILGIRSLDNGMVSEGRKALSTVLWSIPANGVFFPRHT